MAEKFVKTILDGLLGPLLLLLIVFGSPVLALCMDNNAEDKGETIESALIKDKGDYGILIDGRQYRVNESTLVLDLLGKKIPLCDLPVPCEALVEYQRIKGMDPVCLRIEMRRLLEDSKDKE
ncbi:MAG: hypothetical protein JRD04_13415 [Deltaproteobacteria bacterium]|nr:hypothetical protein [Deltaproteobacteria bacterium]